AFSKAGERVWCCGGHRLPAGHRLARTRNRRSGPTWPLPALGPVDEFTHVLGPERRVNHGQVPIALWRPLLDHVTAVLDPRHRGLKDLQRVRIELIVGEGQRVY